MCKLLEIAVEKGSYIERFYELCLGSTGSELLKEVNAHLLQQPWVALTYFEHLAANLWTEILAQFFLEERYRV
jgi:hypothetical protein